jgi:putative ABC transport system permease protein
MDAVSPEQYYIKVMLKSYLLVSLRNMMRNKTVSLINIIGFGLGIASFLFVVQIAVFEYSFDNFHKNTKNIYRVSAGYTFPGGSIKSAGIEPALSPLLKDAVPEIQHAARFIPQQLEEPYCVVSYIDHNGKRKAFNELHAWYADPDFLSIFRFEMVAGNPKPLAGSSGLVMTRSCARKYFGEEDPIGKMLEITTGATESKKTKFSYQVEAVLEDIPPNSTLQFDILLPFSAFEDNYQIDIRSNWRWHGSFHTFVEVEEHTIDIASLEEKVYNTVPEDVRSNWIDTGVKDVVYHLNPFQTVHFDSEAQHASESARLLVTNKRYMLILVLIGFAILVIAEMNYISLTTAKALKRVKEVSVRKIVGAGRRQLTGQFLLDACLNVSFGLIFALTLLQVTKPMLAQMLGISLPQVTTWNFQMIGFVTVFITTVLLMGFAPSYYLSRVAPVSALRGRVAFGGGAGILRKILVVIQFTASVALICVTYVIVSQLTFMQSQETGIAMDHRIAIRAVGTEDLDFQKFRRFKDRIQTQENVEQVTAGASIPGHYGFGGPPWSTGDKPEEADYVRISQIQIDFDYLSTLGIPVLAGREFTKEHVSDEPVGILNERALQTIGVASPEEAIGKSLYFHWVERKKVTIVGVVGNTTFNSPGARVEPIIYTFANTTHPFPKYRHYVVNLRPGDTHETIKQIKTEWDDVFAGAPFEYFFLDEGFQRVFEGEKRLRSVAVVSSALAIFIACMGLGGLVAYSVVQRTKEIGIRKTLGASLSRILVTLSADFVKLIFIAMVIAIPVVWYMANDILADYENRIQLSPWIFIVPCLILLGIAVLTMAYQTVKAARSNPVEALKHE